MSESQPHTEPSRPAEPPLPPAEPIVYQPISGWAIAGFGVGAIFAALVAVSTVVALAQGAPIFFPVWILSLAVVGIIFSLIGQRQIQDSEGTRAGAKLARLGVWLSLLSGLGYLSYYYVTGLALQSQANAFLMDKTEDGGFFPRLIEGATDPAQINAAFLLTLPPLARNGRPEDELQMAQLHDAPGKDGAKGPLSQFREGTFPRLFYKQLAKDAKVIPLSVQDWKYEANSYKVYRQYRIETKEVELDVQVAVFSTEAESAGKDRKWFVNMRESYPLIKTLTRTPIGEGIKLLRQSADYGFRLAIHHLNEGAALPKINDIDKTDWRLIHVRDGNRDHIRALLHQTFASNAPNRIKQFGVLAGQEEVGRWEQIDGKIRILQAFRFLLDKEPGGPAFGQVTGFATLETRGAIDPAKFDKSSPLPDWDIVRIVFTQALPVQPSKGQ